MWQVQQLPNQKKVARKWKKRKGRKNSRRKWFWDLTKFVAFVYNLGGFEESNGMQYPTSKGDGGEQSVVMH